MLAIVTVAMELLPAKLRTATEIRDLRTTRINNMRRQSKNGGIGTPHTPPRTAAMPETLVN